MMNRLAYLSILAGLVSLASTTGCSNPRYCEANPGHDCDLMWDASGDTPGKCSANEQCAAPTALCNLSAMTCVQCIAPTNTSACMGTTPACGADNACHACSAHADCGSSACLPDGSCGTDANVAYVDPAGTDNNECFKATPCTKVNKALATGRTFVKFHGTTDEAVTVSNRDATFLADPGAKLTRTNAGVILAVDGTSKLTVFDLSISDGLGSTGIGISMPPGNSATLSLRRTVVSNNAGGGISISGGEFDIVNTIVATNGGATSGLGGVKIDGITANGTHRLEFSTITANVAPATVNTGISCGTVLVGVSFANDIVFANVVSGGGKQIGGSANCTATYSDVGPDAIAGTGNINADPAFVNASQHNFHLMTGSPAKDAADPAATLSSDLDQDSRPQGTGRDMGADEFK